MTGVYPNLKTYFRMRVGFANDLWALPQQHSWRAGRQATSKGNRHGTIHTIAPQPPSADPLGGPARNPNIMEMFE